MSSETIVKQVGKFFHTFYTMLGLGQLLHPKLEAALNEI